MTDVSTLTPEARLDLARAAWYSHDARWFNAVAEEFGFDTANHLNQRAVLAMAVPEARRLAKALGIERCDDLPGFLEFIEAAAAVYVPASMIEMSTNQLDDRSYEVNIARCFVAENIARAGIADSYECAVFRRVHAWHEALELPLEGPPPALPCAIAHGQPCRRVLTLAEPEGDSPQIPEG